MNDNYFNFVTKPSLTNILLALFLTFSSPLFAQEAQSFLVEPGYTFFEMLKDKDKMYVVYSSDKENKILISCYDQSMKALWQNRHSIIAGDQKIVFEKFFVFEKQLFQATSILNATSNKYELFVQPYDQVGKLSGERLKLAEMNPEPEIKSRGVMPVKNYIDFNFITSEDGSKLLLSYSDINSIEQNVFLNCKIYDGTLKKVTEKKIDIPYADKRSLIDRVELSNAGDVFILTRVFNADVFVIASLNDSGFAVNSRYLAYFFHYDKQKDELTKQLVARSVKTYSQDLEIEGVCNYELDNTTNTVNFYGWAWGEDKTAGYNGLYFMLYNIKTKKIDTDLFIPFKDDLKIKMIGEKETAAGSSFSFNFDRTFTFSNGNICLLGHTYNLLKKYKKGSSKGTSYRISNLDPKLLYMTVSPKGEVINSEIFENHATNPLHYYSFFDAEKDKLRIVYRNIADEKDRTSTIEIRSDGTSEHKYQESVLTQKMKNEQNGESYMFNDLNLIFLSQEFLKVTF